jgi:hypothetical protein
MASPLLCPQRTQARERRMRGHDDAGAITGRKARDPTRDGADADAHPPPWLPHSATARGTPVTAPHVRMVLGRDRVRGRESIGRSSETPRLLDRTTAIPSAYARKHLRSHPPNRPHPSRRTPAFSPPRRALLLGRRRLRALVTAKNWGKRCMSGRERVQVTPQGDCRRVWASWLARGGRHGNAKRPGLPRAVRLMRCSRRT